MFDKEIHIRPLSGKVQADIEVAWCFPHTYSIGMSGLGYQLIYGLLDQQPDVKVDRVFTDVEETVSRQCGYFGFTVSWELDFINVLTILRKHGIALLAKDRDDDAPIIFAGGPVLSANPEPFGDIFDVVLLGDAEETIPRLVQTIREISGIKCRSDKLKRLAQCDGLYVPSLYQFEFEDDNGPIKQVRTTESGVPQNVSKLLFRAPEDYLAHSIILSPDTTWGDTFLMEIVRSCPQECRFCLASFLTRPFRTSSVETILNKVDLARAFTNKIGLMGPSITEHPEFDSLLDGLLTKEGLQVTVASVRADTLTQDLVRKLNQLGQKTVTIALESGSERLRTIMKKNLTEPEVRNAVDAIESGGMKGVKFYGIAGLPYENDHDVEETVRLLKDLKKAHRQLKIVFGLSSFVPKAQTPFQWKGRDRESKRKMEYLRKKLAPLGIDVRPESHNWSDIQALLSRGDRRLTPVLLEVAQSAQTLGSWKKAIRNNAQSVPGLDYYAYRDIDEKEILPWSHLANESKNAFLVKHLVEASNAAQT